MAEAQVQIDVNAQDNASRTLERMQGKTQDFSRSFRDAGRDVGKTAVKMTSVIGTVGGALGAVAGREFAKFEDAMAGLESAADDGGQSMEELKQQAQDIGKTTKFSATEAASAMDTVARSTLDAKDSQEVLRSTTDLAAKSTRTLKESTEATTSIMDAFNKKPKDTRDVVDSMTAVLENSDISLQTLKDTMGEVGPLAEAAGISFESAAGSLLAFKQNGFEAQEAQQILSTTMERLQEPTKDMREALNKARVSMKEFRDESGDLKDVDEIFQTLRESGASTAEIMEVLGEEGGVKLARKVQKGELAMGEFTDKVRNSKGDAKEAAQTYNDTLGAEMKSLQSAFNDFTVSVFGSSIQELAKGAVSNLTEEIEGVTEEVKQLGNEAKSTSQNSVKNLGNKMKNTKKETDKAEQSFLDQVGTLDQVGSTTNTLIQEVKGLTKFTDEAVAVWQHALKPALLFVADVAMSSLLTAFRTVREAIEALIRTGVAIADTLRGIFFLITGQSEKARKSFSRALSGMKDAVISALQAAWNYVLTFGGGKILKFFKLLPGKMFSALRPLAGKLISPFRNAINGANRLISNFVSGVWQFFHRKIPRIISRAAGALRNAIGGAIRSEINRAKGILSRFNPLAFIRGAFEGLGSFIPNMIAAPIRRGIDLASRAIRRFAPGELFKDAFNAVSDFNLDISGALPGRAEGGSVQSGRSFIVGERGPEIFTPNQSGTITSNEDSRDMMGGGINVENLTINQQPGEDGRSLANRVVEELSKRQELEGEGVNLPL